MKRIFNKKFVLAYLSYTVVFVIMAHATGNAPWSEITPEKYVNLDNLPDPGKDLYRQSMEDGKVSFFEYAAIHTFHNDYKRVEKEELEKRENKIRQNL